MPPLTSLPGARRPKQPLVYWPVLFAAIVFMLAFVVVLTLEVCSADPVELSGLGDETDEELVVVHRPPPHAVALHALPTEEMAVATVPEPAPAAQVLAGAPVQAPVESAPHKPPSVAPSTPKKVEVAEKPADPPMPEKIEKVEKPADPPAENVETVEKPAGPPPAEKVEVAKKPSDVRETFGTSVEFVESPAKAASLAKKEKLLQFVLHISGNFEDSAFT
jgi:outer membrane biosynthesis protein TonB